MSVTHSICLHCFRLIQSLDNIDADNKGIDGDGSTIFSMLEQENIDAHDDNDDDMNNYGGRSH